MFGLAGASRSLQPAVLRFCIQPTSDVSFARHRKVHPAQSSSRAPGGGLVVRHLPETPAVALIRASRQGGNRTRAPGEPHGYRYVSFGDAILAAAGRNAPLNFVIALLPKTLAAGRHGPRQALR